MPNLASDILRSPRPHIDVRVGVVIDQPGDSVKSYFRPWAPWTWIRYPPADNHFGGRRPRTTVRGQGDRLQFPEEQKRLMVMAGSFSTGKPAPQAAAMACHIHPLFALRHRAGPRMTVIHFTGSEAGPPRRDGFADQLNACEIVGGGWRAACPL